MTMTSLLLALTLLAPTQTGGLSWTPKNAADRAAFKQAHQALLQKAPARAEKGLRALLKRDPSCAPCKENLARAMLFNNQPDAAYLLLKDLLAVYPRVHRLRVETAWAAFAAERFSAAQRLSLAAVGQQPGDADALNVLMQTLVRTGDVKTAHRMLKRVRSQHAAPFLACLDVTVLAEENKIDVAERALSRCRQHDDPHLVAAAEHRLAVVSGDEKRFLTKGSRRLAKRSPTRAVRQAVNFHAAGKLKEAKKVLLTYVKKYRRDLYARGVLGVVRYQLGEKKAARADLEACLQGSTWIDTHDDGSLSGILTRSAERQLFMNLQRFAAALTQLYLEDGDLERAQKALSAAERYYRETPELFEAQTRLAFAQKRPAAAWQTLAAGLKKFPGDAALLQLATEFVTKVAGAPPAIKEALEQSRDWRLLFNLAVEEQHAESYASCLQHALAAEEVARTAAGAKPSAKKSERAAAQTKLEKAQALGFHCAVEARDLEATRRLLELATVRKKKAGSVFRHAFFLDQEGDTAGALAAVLLLPTKGDVGRQRANAAAGYHGDLLQFDAALKLLKSKLLRGQAADPDTLWNVGVGLSANEREAEGKALKKRACKRAEDVLAEACGKTKL